MKYVLDQCSEALFPIFEKYKTLFFGLFVVSIVAWGAELTSFTLNDHDYWQSTYHYAPKWTTSGRWFLDLLYFYIYSAWFSPFLYMLLGIVFNILTISIIFSIWNIDDIKTKFIAGSIYVTFPYFAGLFDYEMAKATYTFADLLIISGYFFASNKTSSNIISSVMIMLALATYQSSANLLGVVFIFHSIFSIKNTTTRKEMLEASKQLTTKALVCLSGCILYLVSMKISFLFFPEKYMTNNIDIGHSKYLQSVFLFTKNLLWSHSQFITPTNKLLCDLLFAIAFLVLPFSSSISKSSSFFSKITFPLYAPIILCVAVATEIPMSIVSMAGRYHATHYAGIIFSGSLCLILTYGRVLTKNISSILTILIIILNIYSSNMCNFSQHALNLFDQMMVSRIVGRIEGSPEYKNMQQTRWVIVGKLQSNSRVNNLSFEQNDALNRSAFQAPWAYGPVFMFYGIHFSLPTKGDIERAVEYTKNHRTWPDSESVKVFNDGLVIVALSKDVNIIWPSNSDTPEH